MDSCNLSFDSLNMQTNVTLKSQTICDYIIYHIIVLVFFGSISIMLSIATILIFIGLKTGCISSSSYVFFIKNCGKWAVACAILSTGFEVLVILFYVYIVLKLAYFVNEDRLLTVVPHSMATTIRDNETLLDEENNVSREITTPLSTICHSVICDLTQQTNSPVCPICLDTVMDTLIKTQCNHIFHYKCIRQWRQNTCPVCRQRLR